MTELDDYIQLAARINRLDVIKFFIAGDDEVNIDVKNLSGATPIFYACENGHLEMVKLLHKHGADLNVKTRCNRTLFHAACYDGYIDIVKFLLEEKVDFEIEDCDGKTPMDFAKEKNHIEIFELLQLS